MATDRARGIASAFARYGLIAMAGPLIPLGSRTPPTRFRIWRAGNNPGDYGDNNVTPGAVARVMAEYEKRGNLLAIDFEHALNPSHNPDLDPNDPPPIAGQAALRVVETPSGPEVWADPVRWSDCGRPFPEPGKVCCGKHQITSGQRGYISPDWIFDKATREPLEINRLGLVAEPGTYGINLLAARGAAAPRRTTKMNDTEILKALLAAAAGAASSADPDIKAFGEAIGSQCQELAAQKGLDLSAAAPESAPDSAPTAAGSDMDEKIEKMVAASVAKALAGRVAVTAGKGGASLADVNRIVSEAVERSQIIAANKDVLGDLATLLASKPLAEVKATVSAVASKASKGTADATAPRGDHAAGNQERTKVSLVSVFRPSAGK